MARTVAIGVQDYAKLIEGQNFYVFFLMNMRTGETCLRAGISLRMKNTVSFREPIRSYF